MGRKTILLVDDDGVLRELLKDFLERQYDVLEASMYSEAMDCLGKHIDLALVDYSLPDKDGLDVSKEIRRQKGGLPVILMTGYSTEDLVVRALRAGVTDYVRKPFNLSYLMMKLSVMLEGEEERWTTEYVESREAFIIDCIAAFVEENYMKDLTRDQLAEKACMDRHKFSKAFNKRMGVSLPYFLNGLRIRKAAELLKNPDLSISEVARLVGYKSLVQFDRVFKDAYGIPPKGCSERSR